ncbi:hypothetical protein ZIOFF_011294 [Zingiber officinale]|uniref:Uncharacterized protein n=1 Tax=Zingiber officinale TaxID=94328 RepID=A0A8J5LPY5_ZINOF|nr:hypothetical protein ZIOFF_011294 [Zingiber officinale]
MSAAAPVASAPACPFLIPTQLGRRAPIGLQAPGQTHRVHRLRVQHSALPCRLLRLHRPNSRIFLLSCAAGDAAASESLPGSSSPQVLLRNRHSYIINPQNFSPNVLCFHLWSMDPNKRRRINYSTMGGSTPAVAGQAQQQGSFTSGEPYHFLAQYKEVSCSRGPWVCTIHEEDARRHLADIEKTVADQLIHNLLELKLIHDIKEADFSIRGEHHKGLYFKDALPSVTAVKTSLFNAFLQLQDITQQMVDTPP